MPSVTTGASPYAYLSLANAPTIRTEEIQSLIDGVDRYNPDNIVVFEEYLGQQCQSGSYDCLANLALLKLYQFNTHLVKEDLVQNILLKALLAFPSPDFSLCLHLLPPHVLINPPTDSMAELVQNIVEVRNLLERAEFQKFWETYNSGDLYVDLSADIQGFEDAVRHGISRAISLCMTKVKASTLETWLDLHDEDFLDWLRGLNWELDGDAVSLPITADNEAKGILIREDIKLQSKFGKFEKEILQKSMLIQGLARILKRADL